MKKHLLISLVLILVLTSCATGYTVMEKHKSGKMLWLPLTEEAEAKRAEIRERNENLILTEDYYPTLLAGIKNRTREQQFPDVKLKNNLSKYKIGNDDIYTLDKGSYDCIVLYIHGGAYAFSIDQMHAKLCDRLVDELNAKVYMPLYPLAPQADYREAYELLDKLYPTLLALNKPIYIMGDSAGGGLSLAYTEYLKGKGQKLPDKMVLISPWTDVSMTNKDMKAFEKNDVSLAIYGAEQLGKLWVGNLSVKDPLVSPLYGDLKGLPPTLIFVGTDEIMYPDDTILYNKMKALGQEVSIVYGEGLWHVFVASKIPEAETSIKLIKNFVK